MCWVFSGNLSSELRSKKWDGILVVYFGVDSIFASGGKLVVIVRVMGSPPGGIVESAFLKRGLKPLGRVGEGGGEEAAVYNFDVARGVFMMVRGGDKFPRWVPNEASEEELMRDRGWGFLDSGKAERSNELTAILILTLFVIRFAHRRQ